MTDLIKEWKFDYLTATYYLLLQQKGRKKKIALPPLRPKTGESRVTASPTIHASLEHNLDLSDLDDSPDVYLSPQSFRSGSIISERFDAMWRHNERERGGGRGQQRTTNRAAEKTSYMNVIFNTPSVCTGRSPRHKLSYNSPTPTSSTPHRAAQKPFARSMHAG
ncbi:unnamed protein product [Cylicocyclus nassatus]|uniref:Maternal embryonic leucine zipper kinase UBA domain-containing protein n=1 Tax=Cylicocyclus nassatus TaxID=53992 RepID=A0AA36GRQ1_CYLNA|nr:unnamed protein product [Cylicocyclus nassatus]